MQLGMIDVDRLAQFVDLPVQQGFGARQEGPRDKRLLQLEEAVADLEVEQGVVAFLTQLHKELQLFALRRIVAGHGRHDRQEFDGRVPAQGQRRHRSETQRPTAAARSQGRPVASRSPSLAPQSVLLRQKPADQSVSDCPSGPSIRITLNLHRVKYLTDRHQCGGFGAQDAWAKPYQESSCSPCLRHLCGAPAPLRTHQQQQTRRRMFGRPCFQRGTQPYRRLSIGMEHQSLRIVRRGSEQLLHRLRRGDFGDPDAARLLRCPFRDLPPAPHPIRDFRRRNVHHGSLGPAPAQRRSLRLRFRAGSPARTYRPCPAPAPTVRKTDGSGGMTTAPSICARVSCFSRDTSRAWKAFPCPSSSKTRIADPCP